VIGQLLLERSRLLAEEEVREKQEAACGGSLSFCGANEGLGFIVEDLHKLQFNTVGTEAQMAEPLHNS